MHRWLALALLAGCVHGRDHLVLEQWHEYRSVHFVVTTDGDDERVPQLVQRLETLRAAEVQAIFGGPADVPGVVRVIAFAHADDFVSFAGGDGTLGYYAVGQYEEPTLVVPLTIADSFVMAHELAHHLSRYAFAIQPHWFAEGLAHYMETLAYKLADGRRAAGGRLDWVINGLRHGEQVSSAQLLTWDGREFPLSDKWRHGWSWVLYHWLRDQRPKQLARYQGLLEEGAMPKEAWRQAFPEYQSDPAAFRALDAELRHYLSAGEVAMQVVREDPVVAGFDVTPISASRVRLMMLGLRRWWPVQWRSEIAAFKQTELELAAADDPSDAVAQWFALTKKPDRLPALRALAARAPEDFRAWLLLGDEKDAPLAEREAAFRKALALAPDNAVALNNLAWLLVTQDRAAEALPLVNRAVDLAPWFAAAIDTLAVVAARLGKCPEASKLERRSVEIRALSGEKEDSLAKRADAIEKGCGSGKLDMIEKG